LLALGTLFALPASVIVRGVFFPPKLDVPSIRAEKTYQDAALLERAWALPVAARYRSGLLYQANASLCGPTSIVNVERSFGQSDADTDQVLDGTGKCWSGICFMGLSLDELSEVARRATGRKVTLLRDLTLEQFRDELRHANDPSRRYIVNFQRAPLFARGGGHHSPVAGYLEPEDLVFVLDINDQFKPWLVKTERLFKAVDLVDGDKKRGLLRIE
jgi:hypothetical protein